MGMFTPPQPGQLPSAIGGPYGNPSYSGWYTPPAQRAGGPPLGSVLPGLSNGGSLPPLAPGGLFGNPATGNLDPRDYPGLGAPKDPNAWHDTTGMQALSDPYTPPIKNWELWQPSGPGPRQPGYGYGQPPNMQTGQAWTNQYNWQAPAMYRPNAENAWTVYGRPDQYPWPGQGDLNSVFGSLGSAALASDPQAALEAFLGAYDLSGRNTALTRWTRGQNDLLQNAYTVRAAAQPGTQPYSYLDFLQNDATGLLDKMWRDSTAGQQGRNASNFAGRVRSVGGGATGF